MYRPPGKVAGRLEAAIKGVHKLVNNANPEGMYLVFGDGSTPLITVAQMVRRNASKEGTCEHDASDGDNESVVHQSILVPWSLI